MARKIINSVSIDQSDVIILNPDSPSEEGIIFDIRFDCTAILKNPMKWEVIYATSSHAYDQTLASTFVGPMSVGQSRFIMRADPPKLADLPMDEVILAGLLVQVSYNEQEFYRIGYMLYHDTPPEFSEENPDFSLLVRHISMDPSDIITKETQIKWT